MRASRWRIFGLDSGAFPSRTHLPPGCLAVRFCGFGGGDASLGVCSTESSVQSSDVRGRCAGSMIPRAHICSGALLACWWHKPCPYVAMMFDVYVWCMCVEAQETQLISRWRRASPTSCRPFTQGGGGRPFLLSYGHGRYVLRGPAQGARGAAPLKTWHVRAPRPPATRIWRWSELFGQQSRLRRRDSRRWLDKLRMSTMPSVSRGVASHRYNGRKSGATTDELEAQ